jgi:hypothetical protein
MLIIARQHLLTLLPIFALIVCLCVPSSLVAEEDARLIIERVDKQQRLAANNTLSLSKLTSCSYAIKNKKTVCSKDPRIKVVESVSRQLGEQNKDSQVISIVLEPARERGIGMLTYSYDDSEKDTESWLYLSALGKVKRMASGSGEDQEPVAFFGSEFTTEDMESGKTDEYDYEIVQQGAYSGRQVWVIEAKPKLVRIRKTNYSRLLLWVDKERYVAVKVQGYDKYDQLYKRTVFKGFEKINALWIARDMTVFNLKINRLSNLHTQKHAMGVELDPLFLTQRSLTDLAFRERHLEKLRQFF